MSEADPSFENRLESMERRLADIQRELAPEPQPTPEPAPEPALAEPIPLRPRGLEWLGLRPAPRRPESPAPEPSRDAGELELLGTMYSDLLGSVRRLLDGYEAALRRLSHPTKAPAEAPIELTAGPFRDTAALREFQRNLSRLPGVRDVELRGYQSGDRAIIEVHLEQETS